jgi:hypothetical protein
MQAGIAAGQRRSTCGVDPGNQRDSGSQWRRDQCQPGVQPGGD